MRESTSLIVIYDSTCGFCIAAARWLRRHDRWGRVELEPVRDVIETRGRRFVRADLEREMHVVDAAGRVYRGFRSWRRIARDIPILMPVIPVVWLPGVSLLGDRIYRWIAGHRTLISRWLRLERSGDICVAAADGAARCDRR